MFLFAVLLYIASVCNLLLVCLVTALWLDACRLPTYCICCVSVLRTLCLALCICF